MIGDGKKYHYLAVTNLSGLLQGNSSNHREDFYCLNCFNLYTTENKLKEHEVICSNHDSCRIEMPNEPILKYNPGEKSLKAPFLYIFDLECLLKKVESCQNNPKKSYKQKKARHEPSGWSLYRKSSFGEKENKLYHYRGKDCIEKFCEKLKEDAMKTINREKKEIIQWSQEELIVKMNKKYIIHAKKSFVWIKMIKIIITEKRLKIIVIILETLEDLPIVFAI